MREPTQNHHLCAVSPVPPHKTPIKPSRSIGTTCLSMVLVWFGETTLNHSGSDIPGKIYPGLWKNLNRNVVRNKNKNKSSHLFPLKQNKKVSWALPMGQNEQGWDENWRSQLQPRRRALPWGHGMWVPWGHLHLHGLGEKRSVLPSPLGWDRACHPCYLPFFFGSITQI